MLKTCYGIRILDPQRLRTFRSVVATGSVQGAADQLRLTSSAVSQQLTVLQRETGLTLLERVGRGVRPTPAGMTVAIASGDALRSLNRLGALVRDLREGKTGHLTIGHFSSAGLAWMPRIVKRMRAEYPDVMIELVLNEAFDGSLPTKPDIDVRIHIEGEPQPAGFNRVPLLDDPFVIAIHKKHPFAGRHSVRLGDLRDDEFVANDWIGSPVHQIQANAYASAGFSTRYIVHAADHLMALAFVDAGIGVTMLPVLAAVAIPALTRRAGAAGPQHPRDDDDAEQPAERGRSAGDARMQRVARKAR